MIIANLNVFVLLCFVRGEPGFVGGGSVVGVAIDKPCMSAAPLAKKLLPAISLVVSSVALVDCVFVFLGGFDLEVVFELLLVLVLVLRHLPK